MIDADHELRLIRATQRDPAAFGPLYEVYADLVWRYCLSRLRSPENAADATSQTFVKALAALPTFRPERRGDTTTFRAWLMLIARNVVIDESRKHRYHLDLDDPAVSTADGASLSPEEVAIAGDRRRRLLRAFDRLTPVQRRVVELRLAGQTGEEIALALGMSVGGVKSAHYRAVTRLRDLLREEGDPS